MIPLNPLTSATATGATNGAAYQSASSRAGVGEAFSAHRPHAPTGYSYWTPLVTSLMVPDGRAACAQMHGYEQSSRLPSSDRPFPLTRTALISCI